MKKPLAVLTGTFILLSFAAAEDSITVSEDFNSSYKPTTIVNGDFDECPWQGFVFDGKTYTASQLRSSAGNILSGSGGKTVDSKLWNGVGEGWNTTETTLFSYGKLYDWAKRVNGNYVKYAVNATYVSTFESEQNFSFIEMNGYNQSVFYQDLTTQGKDVIRWTLNHARRGENVVESIAVQIGAPERDSSGALIPATSNQVSDKLNPKIKKEGWAKFTSDGVTNNDSTHPYGFDTGDLKYLTITTSDDRGVWKKASGVYIIPENQNVTRFAFISVLPATGADGNLLDSITFSTLIGNLNAYADWNASVVVSGYWGETDSSKKLCIELINEDGSSLGTKTIDMSGKSGKNFKIEIPESVVTGAKYVKIYHQEYVSAAETIEIERHYHNGELFGVWNYSDKLPATGRYALGTDVVLSSDVTLTGSSEMTSLGGAKICLNGHTISGANVIVSSGDNKLTITSISTYDNSLGTIQKQLEVKGGDFTLNGGNVSTLKVTDGTCTVTGLVNVDALNVASGKVLTIDNDIDIGSAIYLPAEPQTGVFTSGFAGGGLDIGQVINLPSGVTDYLLLKTKSGELKVKQHKSAW